MITLTAPLVGVEEEDAVIACLREGQLSPGKRVAEFEDSWAAVVGTRHAVAVGSGTLALTLALRAVLQGGTRPLVVTSDFTCAPTVAAVHHAGARTLTVDCSPSTLGLDPRALRSALGGADVLLPVHVYGAPVDQEVFAICAEENVAVVEDACEAAGARIPGLPDLVLGSLGRAGAFSFRGDKMITTAGVGGAVTTNDDQIARFVRDNRDSYLGKGVDRYFAHGWGTGGQMSEPQAAFGLVQIQRLPDLIERRRAIAAEYSRLLIGSAVTPPDAVPGHVWWRYMVRLPTDVDPVRVCQELAEKGIETVRAFTPMSQLKIPVALAHEAPVAESLFRTGLCLPIGPHMSLETVAIVVEHLLEVVCQEP